MSALRKFLEDHTEQADDADGILTFTVMKDGRVLVNAVEVPETAFDALVEALRAVAKRLEETELQ